MKSNFAYGVSLDYPQTKEEFEEVIQELSQRGYDIDIRYFPFYDLILVNNWGHELGSVQGINISNRLDGSRYDVGSNTKLFLALASMRKEGEPKYGEVWKSVVSGRYYTIAENGDAIDFDFRGYKVYKQAISLFPDMWRRATRDEIVSLLKDEKVTEEFIKPEKWVIERTPENAKVLNKYFNELYNSNGYSNTKATNFIHYPKFFGRKSNYSGEKRFRSVSDTPQPRYALITFEQFKKYFMGMYIDNICGSTVTKIENITGYKFKPEFDDDRFAEAARLITTSEASTKAFKSTLDSLAPNSYFASKLRAAGVLDIWFDPIHEQSIKIGDIFEVDDKIVIVKEINDITSRSLTGALYMKSGLTKRITEEEALKVCRVSVAGYQIEADLLSNYKIGCVHFSKSDVEFIQRMLDAGSSVKIRNVEITTDFINKVINYMYLIEKKYGK